MVSLSLSPQEDRVVSLSSQEEKMVSPSLSPQEDRAVSLSLSPQGRGQGEGWSHQITPAASGRVATPLIRQPSSQIISYSASTAWPLAPRIFTVT